jgi:hypothetical protein
MFIFKTTKLRANPYAPYTAPDGTRYPRIPMELLDEIPDPQPPEDYSPDTYFRTEQDDAPYVVYTRKSDEQIAVQRLQQCETALDNFLDATAKERRYNDRFTFALRAGYPGPWQAEGQAFAVWMDGVNAQAYQLLQDVQAGIVPMPTVAEFLATLPAFVWPPEPEA